VNFSVITEHFRQFLSGVRISPSKTSKEKVGIAIIPWMQTPVPYFSAALGLLYQKKGYNVELIVHDVEFLESDRHVIQLFESVFAESGIGLATIRLSSVGCASLTALEQEEVRRLFQMNEHSYLRRNGYSEVSTQDTSRLCESLLTVGRHLKKLLSLREYDHVVVPGGIYGQSGIYSRVSDQLRIASYDSGLSSIVVGTQSVAAYCEDVERHLRSGNEHIELNRDTIIFLAQQEFYRRTRGKDKYKFQVVGQRDNAPALKADVLIPLNLFDDAAGIGRLRTFREPNAWLDALLSTLSDRGLSIVVREHPDARRYATDRSLFACAKKKYAHVAGIHFVAAEERINTYGLLSEANVVLPVSSTVGIEAACFGVPVVMESKAYYAQANFIDFAPTREEYLECAILRSTTRTRLTNKKMQEAWIWYYFSQVANCLKTTFTPQPQDFLKWTDAGLQGLERDRDVEVIVESLSRNMPLCHLIARNQLSSHKYVWGKFIAKNHYARKIEAMRSGLARNKDLSN
jgi:hypothetical protein